MACGIAGSALAEPTLATGRKGSFAEPKRYSCILRDGGRETAGQDMDRQRNHFWSSPIPLLSLPHLKCTPPSPTSLPFLSRRLFKIYSDSSFHPTFFALCMHVRSHRVMVQSWYLFHFRFFPFVSEGSLGSEFHCIVANWVVTLTW